jgi:hypothetical protein
MALAIALACAVVAFEFASDLSYRSAGFRHRLAQLGARIDRMRGQMAMADRQLADMRSQEATRNALNAILAAPDARLIRLVPPLPNALSSGIVVISKRQARAVLEVAGLPPSPAPSPANQVYTLWWTLQHRPPVKGVQFNTAADGRAALALQLPPHDELLAAGFVTRQANRLADQPDGPIELSGVVSATGRPRK